MILIMDKIFETALQYIITADFITRDNYINTEKFNLIIQMIECLL